MKVLIASIAIVASLSFSTAAHKPKMQPARTINPKSNAGNAWKVEETFTLNNLTLYTCKAEPVFFETFIITEDLHGVINNNISLVQGKSTFYATGYSLLTGEVYHFAAEGWSNGKFPIVNGAVALTSIFKGGFVGEGGSKDLTAIRSHTTITPNGKIIAFDINPTTVCQ